MDRFIAFGVGEGDCFYLEKGETNILVYGGSDINYLSNNFQRVTGENSVDIAICTHADKDHVQGLINFFKNHSSKELWVPDEWMEDYCSLINSGMVKEKDINHDNTNANANAIEYDKLINFFRYVYDINLQEKEEDIIPLASFNELQINEESIMSSREYDYYKLNHDIHCSECIRSIIDICMPVIKGGRLPSFKFIDLDKLPQDGVIKLLYLAKKMDEFLSLDRSLSIKLYNFLAFKNKNKKLILKLLKEAIKKSVRLRFFKYETQCQPPKNTVYVLNAIEKPLACETGKSDVMTLTTINKESLVIYSPESTSSLGVLFSSDSSFQFNFDSSTMKGNGIITTPHHGSCDSQNERVYGILKKRNILTDDSIMVRSDKIIASRPTSFYTELACKKYCTICNNENKTASPREVEIQSINGIWVNPNTNYNCTCKPYMPKRDKARNKSRG